jgi:hypothetical protein
MKAPLANVHTNPDGTRSEASKKREADFLKWLSNRTGKPIDELDEIAAPFILARKFNQATGLCLFELGGPKVKRAYRVYRRGQVALLAGPGSVYRN